jgi:predicted lipoprotein with Yx(FWY)xxD motif
MKNKRTYTALIALLAAAIVLVVSACGGGDGSGVEGSAPDSDATAATVAVSNVDGVGEVLVDSEGAALYASDQEASGTVLCTDSCETIWIPLTVDGQPTGGDGLRANLGVVMRPDGTQQVSFEGRPLYSFVEDTDGAVTGNGFSDAFGDQQFTWHVATPTGISTTDENSDSSPTTGPYEGGYGN